VNWTPSVWRGPSDDYEAWEPLDAAAAAEALDELPGATRIDDAWSWDGEGGLNATITLYSMTDETPINEIGVSVVYPPSGTAGKRADLHVLGGVLFEAAARTDAVVGELEHGTFADVAAFVRRGLAADPWPDDEPAPPPKSHVTRRELFTRFLHRD
jgi:hypothetical protein